MRLRDPFQVPRFLRLQPWFASLAPKVQERVFAYAPKGQKVQYYPGLARVEGVLRVKVRVDARKVAIRVGDLLVTSDTPGTAMRSEPMSINGRPFHQPGTIIGKALEPLQDGVGEILVLLSMQ